MFSSDDSNQENVDDGELLQMEVHTPERGHRTLDLLADIPMELGLRRVPTRANTLATPWVDLPTPRADPLVANTNTNNPVTSQTTPLQPLNSITRLTNNTLVGSPELPPGYLSPTPSPNEIVIQQRGRRHLPVTWSPDIDMRRNSCLSDLGTPRKPNPSRLSPRKLDVTLSSTPRKRLIVDDRDPITPEKMETCNIDTPKKFKLNSPVKGLPAIKRQRFEIPSTDSKVPIDIALKGLSPAQLMNIIETITLKHPEMENEIRQEIPMPDLKPLEDRLKYLKSNILKSLPTSRLTSKTDSSAYRRAETHLIAFKKCLIDQGKVLVESQHWNSVLDYVFLAWSYVRATPLWDHDPLNVVRKQCFNALLKFCATALKIASFDVEKLTHVQHKLEEVSGDAVEVDSCLKLIRSQIEDL